MSTTAILEITISHESQSHKKRQKSFTSRAEQILEDAIIENNRKGARLYLRRTLLSMVALHRSKVPGEGGSAMDSYPHFAKRQGVVRHHVYGSTM